MSSWVFVIRLAIAFNAAVTTGLIAWAIATIYEPELRRRFPDRDR